MKRITAIFMAVMMLIIGAAAAFGEEVTIWRKGDSGEKVQWIQTRLIELEYLEGEADGQFDDDTEAALIRFQRDHYLMATGMADSVTMDFLATTTMTADDYAYDVYTEEAGEYESAAVAGAGYYAKTEAAYAPVPMATSRHCRAPTLFMSMAFTAFLRHHLSMLSDNR